MAVPQALLILAIAWLVVVGTAWLVVVPVLRRGPGGRADWGALWVISRVLGRIIHRTRYEGLEHLPRRGDVEAESGGLIVVANHTGAVDPLLIQGACRFWIRWMMAEDMMSGPLEGFWEEQRIIAVDRANPDSASLREAIRWTRGGGVLGIFPEGRITMPPRELRPFLPGVGLIVKQSRAPVLLVWVSGTPETNRMRASLLTRSRARVVFLGVIDYAGERDATKISEDLRRRLHEASGWPLNDEVLPPGGPPVESAP